MTKCFEDLLIIQNCFVRFEKNSLKKKKRSRSVMTLCASPSNKWLPDVPAKVTAVDRFTPSCCNQP